MFLAFTHQVPVVSIKIVCTQRPKSLGGKRRKEGVSLSWDSLIKDLQLSSLKRNSQRCSHTAYKYFASWTIPRLTATSRNESTSKENVLNPSVKCMICPTPNLRISKWGLLREELKNRSGIEFRALNERSPYRASVASAVISMYSLSQQSINSLREHTPRRKYKIDHHPMTCFSCICMFQNY